MAVLGAVALVLFGPDRLPGVARKAGKVMRDVQNTSQSFIREMERAADAHEPPDAAVSTADPYAVHLPDPAIPEAPLLPDALAAAHDPQHPATHESPVTKPAGGSEPQPF